MNAARPDALAFAPAGAPAIVVGAAASATGVALVGAAVAAKAWRAAQSGFTLVELLVALMLLAIMGGVVVGSVALSARTWDGGEAKAVQVSEMRQTQEFLREHFAALYPQRIRKAQEVPLMFGGERNEVRYAAALPPRVIQGGIYYFRLALAGDGERTDLVLERVIPDAEATAEPRFDKAERSVLATGIAELVVNYFGRDPGSLPTTDPTWRDRWDDRQRLPDLIRVEVKPKQGPAWPVLVVEPRRGPEAGCRSWDPARGLCVGAG